jgi:hypothetical protein
MPGASWGPLAHFTLVRGPTHVVQPARERAMGRPVCIELGCTNLAAIHSYRKDGSPRYRRSCKMHHCQRYGMTLITSVPEYLAWREMIRRCTDPQYKDYPRYGGRGIRVCRRWLDSWRNFLADMGSRPDENYSIERKDNDGNYEPSNCVWATKHEQNRNKRNNHWLTLDGQTLVLEDWARRLGTSSATIRWRLRHGWSVAQALTPVRRYGDG